MSTMKIGTDIWIPAIDVLWFGFLKELYSRPGGRFLNFNKDYLGTMKNPGIIVNEYKRTVSIYNKKIFSKNAGEIIIDYHIVAALYIRSFLKYKPFFLDIPNETKNIDTCLYTEFPNEYFIIPFLEAMFKACNDDFDGILAMNPNYRENFINLLISYKENISRLEPIVFSRTISAIEQQYFIRSF